MEELPGHLASQVALYRSAARSMSWAYLSLSEAGQLEHAEQVRTMACDLFSSDEFDYLVNENSKSF